MRCWGVGVGAGAGDGRGWQDSGSRTGDLGKRGKIGVIEGSVAGVEGLECGERGIGAEGENAAEDDGGVKIEVQGGT